MFESDIVVIFKHIIHSCLLNLLGDLLLWGDLLHNLLWWSLLWGSLLSDLLGDLLGWGCYYKIKSVSSSTSNWFLFIDKFNFLNSRSRTQDEIIGPDFFQRHFGKCLRISTTSTNEVPCLPIKPSPCSDCLSLCLHGPGACTSRDQVASEKMRKYLPFFGTDFFAAAAFAIWDLFFVF